MRSSNVAALVVLVLLLAGCAEIESANPIDDRWAGSVVAGVESEPAEGPTGAASAGTSGAGGTASTPASDDAGATRTARSTGVDVALDGPPTVGSTALADDTDAETSPSDDEGWDDASGSDEPAADEGLVAVSTDERGDAVEALQARLDELGFAPGPVDGVFGPQTAAAVEAFQTLQGMKASGVADARTVAAIEDFESDVEPLRSGDEGPAVRDLQRRLADAPFDPGPADGVYGGKTVEAVWALEKVAGIPVDGAWGPLDEHALARFVDGKLGGPTEQHDQRWVEVDLSQQLVKIYDPGSAQPFLVSHASSGNGQRWCNENHCGTSVTPTGTFHIDRRISGWRESSLDIGRLYNPLYFNGGIAFHGALSVPLYPASHGCVRLPMHVAEYLPAELPNGTPVHVMQ